MISTRFVWRGVLLGVPLVLSLGCKEDGVAIDRDEVADDLSDAVCESFFACECESDQFPNLLNTAEACADAIRPAVENAVAQAEFLGLEYYKDCLGRTRDVFELTCGDSLRDPEDVAEVLFNAGTCKIVAGDGGAGDPCSVVGSLGFGTLGDTCGQDLTCNGELCLPVSDSRGDLCLGGAGCPPDLGCIDPDFDGVRTCEPPPVAGDSCNVHDGGSACEQDSFCLITSNTCVALPAAGQSCVELQCASGNVCAGGLCEPLPLLGQPCPQGACNEGLSCHPQEFNCVVSPGEGQLCLGGAGCAEGLTCGEFGRCERPPAFICVVPESLGLCIYQNDGICDGPEGTGLCPEGTDIEDCLGFCPSQNDGICDEPEGTGACAEGTDFDDCQNFCPSRMDGMCDEPGGTGLCPPASDPEDCANFCPTQNDGVCDESTGSGLCVDGSDPFDCGRCETANDGSCDEPQGTGICPLGSDTVDCADFCPTTNNGLCDEPEGGNTCPEGSDVADCIDFCPTTNNGLCDEPEGGNTCPEGSDVVDCFDFCPTTNNGICDEPEGGNTCPEGSDVVDCIDFCPTTDDMVCNEPEGTNTCPEGSDVNDCAMFCPTTNDMVCNEPEGDNTCPEGSDFPDCP